MMMQVQPCCVDHLDNMDLLSEDREGIFSLGGIDEILQEVISASARSGTLLVDDRPLCLLGFNKLWPGVADCWLIPSRLVFVYPMIYARAVKNYIDEIIKDDRLHRLQTACHDTEQYEKWMYFLGFKKEGVLKQYTHNRKDMVMYARVIKWDS